MKRLKTILFLLTLITLFSCQKISNQVPPYLLKVVENVKKSQAPDTRVEMFNIKLEKRGDQLIVSGELINPEIKRILLDSLHATAKYYDLLDSIKVLPDAKLGANMYGITYVSVANMRRQPKHSAELINQVILGTTVKLFKKKAGYYFAQNCDQYLGWLSSASMVEVDSLTAQHWDDSQHVICTANYGLVYSQPNTGSDIVVDLVPGAKLGKIIPVGNWIKVKAPDGRTGFVKNNLVVDEKKFNQIVTKRKSLVETAKGFAGIPYLWGGTSAKGFDCSGFVQTVYRMNNYFLPRDANQMAAIGEAVDTTGHFEKLSLGDLLFFGSSANHITHVAFYLGKRKYIHADGWVHINSFDPRDPLYNHYRHSTFRIAKKILTE